MLEPDELLAKLATLVPPPRVHGLRYHGVFAPNARGRARVVPEAAEAAKRCAGSLVPEPKQEAPAQPPRAAAAGRVSSPREYRIPWAELLRKVFAADVLGCPDCGGRLQVVAYIAEEAVACRILERGPGRKVRGPAGDGGRHGGQEASVSGVPAVVRAGREGG